MRVRAFGLRKITFKKYPSFVTIEKNRTYPKGYEITKLGPENLVKNTINGEGKKKGEYITAEITKTC